MQRIIDLKRSVYELVTEYPELKDILAEVGFAEIRKSTMLHSVGKMMTLPRGAKMKGIPMEILTGALLSRGFILAGSVPDEVSKNLPNNEKADPAPQSRADQLKEYLYRLGKGEPLKQVREDFVKKFQHVDATEIMEAEQELRREGVPLKQVQRLCDIHSALFHGAAQEDPAARGLGDRHVRVADLAAIPGHPLHTLTGENEILGRWIQEARERLASRENLEGILERIREVAIHYAKKGDLLYPLLNVGHGLPGPSEVMWTVDDEIRDELKAVCTSPSRDKAWEGRLQAVLQRVEEMIFKENNILFPICAANFTDEEWRQIYRDSQDYEPCLGTVGENWPEGEGQGNLPGMAAPEGEIVMPGGHLTLPQLTALLNTLPVEISFVDGDNINRFFNEGPKVFKRPAMAIDRDVFSCHPPKIQPIVRAIIGDFRSGRQDSVPVWMEKNGRTYLVTYMAVRDSQKNYLGTLEVVQDMEAAKAHFGK